MSIPINAWTIALALTAAAWGYIAHIIRTEGGGDFNVLPAILGFVGIVGTVALWGGLILAKVL